jgi:HD-GYP domain-containing protein (c-di-GMP phosphodiesterase class II)
MRLGKPVHTASGQVLINVNTVLTESMIRRLRQMGYDYVYIEEPETDDIRTEDAISPETRMALRTSLEQLIERIERIERKPKAGMLSVSRLCWDSVTMMIRDMKYVKDDTIMLKGIVPPGRNQLKEHFIQNAINVCVYATMIGISEGYTGKDLMAFSLGGLLHDIGQLMLPSEILGKPSPLTAEEYELVKRHTVIGYEMLRHEPGMPMASALCALMHHERVDGGGYPNGFKGHEIHPFARWIGLIDAYDSMTNPRPHRKALLPTEAMEILYTQAGSLYDYDKVDRLRKKLAIFPVGMQVKLSTGQPGIVSRINPSFIHRPVVRVMTDESGMPLDHPVEIDLSRHLNVVISEVGRSDERLLRAGTRQ